MHHNDMALTLRRRAAFWNDLHMFALSCSWLTGFVALLHASILVEPQRHQGILVHNMRVAFGAVAIGWLLQLASHHAKRLAETNDDIARRAENVQDWQAGEHALIKN